MAKSKKLLRERIEMLNCFADAYRRMRRVGSHSLYEFSIMLRNEHGNLVKVFRYELGTSFLPDHASECYESLIITLLKKKDIDNLITDCVKYGIEY